MNQLLILVGLTLATSQVAAPLAFGWEVSWLSARAPGGVVEREMKPARTIAGPASPQSTVHRATGATPQVACGRANTAASARAKRLGTCVLKLATPESCKVANGLYTAEAVSADAKCYPAHPPHKPPVLLEH